MNAQAILDSLHRRGVRLRVNGDRLRWFAPVGVVTEADLSALRQHKAEALAIIREEQSDRIEERAAILQFDAYLSRRQAERRARNEQHPAPVPEPGPANGGNAA